ncbi:MAG TPA: Fe-Mn family superoxide dismutase [Polyangiaceae bacterium]|nr:Fe-Mn family superoxide dismutase [Polyangiaceae bacterium]
MNPTRATTIVSRRTALLSVGAAGAALVTGCAARAQGAPQAPAGPSARPPAAPPPPAGSAPPAAAGAHAVKPLPFRADALKGLSERLIVSHHENNYGGAVKNLNRVEGELARVTKDTPAFVVGGLKQSELVYRNSATLHELYFGNLGGDGRASGAAQAAIAQAYGGFGRWEELFRATGASLGGGSGWVVLAYDLYRDGLATFWSGNHAQTQAASAPLLVLDMYEHAYQIDYGAAAAKYIDAFFANLQWDEVNRRLERARRAAAALRG